MTFQEMVQANNTLSQCVRKGLKALSKGKKDKVNQGKNTKVTCSVDIDSCLQLQCPDLSRWDYGLGVGSRSIFLEIHPATTGEVEVVLKKLRWLKDWMRQNCPGFSKAEKEYYWLATGKVAVLKNSPQHRKIAASGLNGPASYLKL